MRKLSVDLGELAMAFEDATGERGCYLDLETGQVVWISQETRSELEGIYEEIYEPDSEESVDLAEVLQDYEMADWQKEELLEADQVDRLYGSRYIRMPEADSHEGYRDMERFILTVQDESLQDRLWQAIEGRGAFRRFKDVLAGHYREEKRWYAFQDARVRGRILDWLASEGIEPIDSASPPTKEPGPAEPTARDRLLGEVLPFVRAASRWQA